VEWTVAGRGNGDAAGDVLLCESAECNEPLDWWCNERRFKFDTLLFDAWNLEGEFVVLFELLLLRRKRQSSSVVADVDVICVERTEIIEFYHEMIVIIFSVSIASRHARDNLITLCATHMWVVGGCRVQIKEL
jgi:hypothetical protein